MQVNLLPVAGRIGGALSVLIISAMLLSACGTTPEVRYYLISARMGTAEPGALPAGKVVGLGPVTLPEYLDRPQMVTRTSASRLQYHDEHRWAEPLAENIRRVLREDLADLLDVDQVLAYPWPRSRVVNHQVTLDITRFDADSTGTVSLEGHWSLVKEGGSTSSPGRHFTFSVPAEGASPEAVADAHGEALARLAADIARELLQAASAP